MTASDLYIWIQENYGNRGCTIKGIADQLGISLGRANHLTFLLGFRNTILDKTKRQSLNVFSMDPCVQNVLAII